MYASTYSYDGSTNSNDGTMLCALSNIVPDITSENLHEYTWSFKFEDSEKDGKAFTIKNFEIVDIKADRIIKPDNTYPFVLDGSDKTVVFQNIEPFIPTTTIPEEFTTVNTEPTTAVASTALSTEISESEEATTNTIVSDTTVITEPITNIITEHTETATAHTTFTTITLPVNTTESTAKTTETTPTTIPFVAEILKSWI